MSQRILGRMCLRALLVRLVVIVALLANGPGMARAPMHMEHPRDSAGDIASYVTKAHTAAEAMAACQGAHSTEPVTALDRDSQTADQAGAPSSLEDCCQAGDCRACLHQCFAAFAGPVLADLAVPSRQAAEPFLSAHVSAALTNLFRPPIG